MVLANMCVVVYDWSICSVLSSYSTHQFVQSWHIFPMFRCHFVTFSVILKGSGSFPTRYHFVVPSLLLSTSRLDYSCELSSLYTDHFCLRHHKHYIPPLHLHLSWLHEEGHPPLEHAVHLLQYMYIRLLDLLLGWVLPGFVTQFIILAC